jgi:hypothetical protein
MLEIVEEHIQRAVEALKERYSRSHSNIMPEVFEQMIKTVRSTVQPEHHLESFGLIQFIVDAEKCLASEIAGQLPTWVLLVAGLRTCLTCSRGAAASAAIGSFDVGMRLNSDTTDQYGRTPRSVPSFVERDAS